MYTEDDTFEALRRIPVDELEHKHDLSHFAFIHEQYMNDKKLNEKRMKEYKRRSTVRRIIGLQSGEYPRANPYSSLYIQLLESLRSDGTFDGTGWTVDSYIEELNKRMANEEVVKKANNRKVKITIVAGAVPTCIATVTINNYFQPPWYIGYTFDVVAGFIVGMLITKFIRMKGWR